MRIPILIGLPGAGKSTTARLLADRLGLSVFDSDAEFRVARAITMDADDPRSTIMRSFVQRVQAEAPALGGEAARLALARDHAGRGVLADGQLFRRALGETVFRLYETEMLAWHSRRGTFTRHVPDLSASAPLAAENRSLFDVPRAAVPVLLRPSRASLVGRILEDYATYRRLGRGRPIRGAFEAPLDAAAGGSEEPGFQRSLLAARTDAMISELEDQRMEAYERWARAVIDIAEDDQPAQIADRVMSAL